MRIRRNLVRLAARGRERLDLVHARLAVAQDELVAPLSVEERAGLVAALQKILGR
ncbi:hypothetical protein AB0K15_22920 [Amycolatopsis sp. NPDC049253]|uniref:hypothetical protein n=1 Tax=Amycolatopsis sp. NPDC049253 TaxID=3155274 RepID=UPI003425D799